MLVNWWMSHSPRPGPAEPPGAGTRPVSGSAGPGPLSCTRTTIRSVPVQTLTVMGRRPYRCALTTASETANSNSSNGRGVDAPARGFRDPVPGLPRRGVDQRDGRTGRLQRIGRRRQALEVGDFLVAGAGGGAAVGGEEATVGALDDIAHAVGHGGGVVEAAAVHGVVLPDDVDGGLVPVPAGEAPTVALVRDVAGDADLLGAGRHVPLELLPVGLDGARGRGVEAGVGDEADRVGPGQLRPQQVALAVVVADDDRLAGGYPAGHERHDQRQELRVRGVEAGLVHVPDAAVGCSCPHSCAPDFANCSETTGSNSISRATNGGADRSDTAIPFPRA